jgi:hypothetical protein
MLMLADTTTRMRIMSSQRGSMSSSFQECPLALAGETVNVSGSRPNGSVATTG